MNHVGWSLYFKGPIGHPCLQNVKGESFCNACEESQISFSTGVNMMCSEPVIYKMIKLCILNCFLVLRVCSAAHKIPESFLDCVLVPSCGQFMKHCTDEFHAKTAYAHSFIIPQMPDVFIIIIVIIINSFHTISSWWVFPLTLQLNVYTERWGWREIFVSCVTCYSFIAVMKKSKIITIWLNIISVGLYIDFLRVVWVLGTFVKTCKKCTILLDFIHHMNDFCVSIF